MSLDSALTATAARGCRTRPGLASPISFIGWMAVTRLRTTSRSGPLAKMSGGASNSRRLAG